MSKEASRKTHIAVMQVAFCSEGFGWSGFGGQQYSRRFFEAILEFVCICLDSALK